MNTITNEGVLSPIHTACTYAETAVLIANESLACLPTIIDASQGVSNRDTAYWGVSEGLVRRYKVLASIVRLENDGATDLFTARTVVNATFKVKGISVDMMNEAIASSKTVSKAVDALRNLKPIVATDEDGEDEGEGEGEDTADTAPDMTKKVTNWLTSGQGSLRKVLEAQGEGFVLTAEQVSALATLTDLVASINAKATGVKAQEVVTA